MKRFFYSLLMCTFAMSGALSSPLASGVSNNLSTPPITLFAHGILDSGRNQIQGYTAPSASSTSDATKNNPAQSSSRVTIQAPYAYFNFDDAWEPRYGIKLCKFWHCSFGQKNDIDKLAGMYDALTKKYPTKSFILSGVSRGASVIWSFVANHQPQAVKALVLESPFDAIQTSLQAAAEHVPCIINCGLTRSLAQAILKNIAFKYKVDALQPIDMVNQIPLNLPILIICSLEDKLVPAHSSYRLYQALRARGHKDVYILTLKKGKHAKLLQGEDGHQYEAITHAFYKKYGLPHDAGKAQQGKELLSLSQPMDKKQ